MAVVKQPRVSYSYKIDVIKSVNSKINPFSFLLPRTEVLHLVLRFEAWFGKILFSKRAKLKKRKGKNNYESIN